MRWIIYHMPELACAFVAAYAGMPVVLGGRTKISSSAGWPCGSAGGEATVRKETLPDGAARGSGSLTARVAPL